MKRYREADSILEMLTPLQIASVADIYYNGSGVEIDRRKAMELYAMAAEKGDPYALWILGMAYSEGKDVDRNEGKALEMLEKAAEFGVPIAQYEMAMRIPDEKGALLWLYLSAKAGFGPAMKELSDRLQSVDPQKAKKWLTRYYRCRGDISPGEWLGKAGCRPRPVAVNGKVMVKL